LQFAERISDVIIPDNLSRIFDARANCLQLQTNSYEGLYESQLNEIAKAQLQLLPITWQLWLPEGGISMAQPC